MADTRTITVHPDKVSETLEAAFPAADAQRVASLGLLAQLRQAKAAVYRREAARLRQTHADDHPSVLQAEARAATSERFAADLRMESTRSQRPQPEPEDEAWILCGHLWDAARAPIVGAAIALHKRIDGRDAPVEATTTMKDGYFLLRLSVEAPTDEAERLAPVLTDLRREPTSRETEEVRVLRNELRELDALGRAGRLREPDRARLVEGLERYAAIRRIAVPPAAGAVDELRTRIAALEPRATAGELSTAETGELTRLRTRLSILRTAATAALYLRVTGRDGEVLLAEETPTAARLGAVTYRDVEIA
jgi:hypothetical protein